MRIGIDTMGGDFAPGSTIRGSILARKEFPENVEIFLIGDRDVINRYTDENQLDISDLNLVHTPQVVAMGDHPLKAFKEKPDSSIFMGQKLIVNGTIDGFCSAGNTGAMMVGAMQIITSIPGIIRPAIAAPIPHINGHRALLLDVGLNPDARPDVLYQYGNIGTIYSKLVHEIAEPKVALLNIGLEEEKGNMVARSAYQTMKDSMEFDFVGNFEANELFLSDRANVIVTDGFVGNMVLKEAEAFYKVVSMKGVGNGYFEMFDFVGNFEANELFVSDRANVIVTDGFVGNMILKEAEAFYKVVAMKGVGNGYFEMFNFENSGGTPVLGINGPLIIGHGISNEKAIKNMLLHTAEVVEAGLVNRIKEELSR